MDKRALKARIAELEAMENRTAEQEGELKQLRRRLAQLGDQGSQRIVCDHPNAKFGDKFCRNCGEQISMPPREAVAELVREILEKDYEILDEANSSRGNGATRRSDSPESDLLDAQWDAYSNKPGVRLPDEPFKFARAQPEGYGKKFHDRKLFNKATDAEREAELKRIGVSDRDVQELKKRVRGENSRTAGANR